MKLPRKKKERKHGSYLHRAYSLVREIVLNQRPIQIATQFKKICIYQDFSGASNQSYLKNWNFQVYAKTADIWLKTYIFPMQQPPDIFKNKTKTKQEVMNLNLVK